MLSPPELAPATDPRIALLQRVPYLVAFFATARALSEAEGVRMLTFDCIRKRLDEWARIYASTHCRSLCTISTRSICTSTSMDL